MPWTKFKLPDGIDDPETLSVYGKKRLFGSFLRQNSVVRKFCKYGGDDCIPNLAGSVGDDIPMAFPLQVSGLSGAGPGDLPALMRGARCVLACAVEFSTAGVF